LKPEATTDLLSGSIYSFGISRLGNKQEKYRPKYSVLVGHIKNSDGSGM
jgi:hypothetical protein